MVLCLSSQKGVIHPSKRVNCIKGKRIKTTAPNRIRKWSPTLLLTGRYPGYLRRSDGMRSFLDSMAVDEKGVLGSYIYHPTDPIISCSLSLQAGPAHHHPSQPLLFIRKQKAAGNSEGWMAEWSAVVPRCSITGKTLTAIAMLFMIATKRSGA